MSQNPVAGTQHHAPDTPPAAVSAPLAGTDQPGEGGHKKIMVDDAVAVVADNCFDAPIGATGLVEMYAPGPGTYAIRLDPPAMVRSGSDLAILTRDEIMPLEPFETARAA